MEQDLKYEPFELERERGGVHFVAIYLLFTSPIKILLFFHVEERKLIPCRDA